MPPPASEVPSVYKPEGRRLRPSLATEAELKAKAEAAHGRVEALKDRPEDDPEHLQASMDFEEANLDFETFDLKHDPTGALKRERVGADLAEQFADRLTVEKEPAPSVGELKMLTPVFLVNMGELDRLNKESPDFGNEALTRLADALSRKVETSLGDVSAGKPETFYKLYRADNNSFMVRFTEKIPAELAAALQKDLASRAGETGDDGEDVFKQRGVEAPPVIVDMTSIEETLSELPSSLRASDKAERQAVGVLKDVLFTMQDARKIVSRVDRMRDAIRKNEAEAESLYNNFLKKSIAGTFMSELGGEAVKTPVETFEQFKTFLADLDHDPHARDKLWEVAYGKALEDLRSRYEHDAEYVEKIQHFVSERAQSERGKKERKFEIKKQTASRSSGAKLPPDKKPSGEFVEPSRDEATEGLREFARLRNDAGFQSDKLEKAKAQDAAPEELARLEQVVRIAEKRLERERFKRDSATGLELRGSMFKRLESALEDSSKRVAMVSIDMGFLKYFDQVGGRETGDLAILKAAELFQQTGDELSKDGVTMSVHRLGGDEFGMAMVGEASVSPEDFRAAVREVQATVQYKMETSGQIPARTGAKPGYYATNINIGVGAHVYEDGASAQEEGKKYKLASRNQFAEHLVNVADKVMEFQKASNRLRNLLEKMYGIRLLKSQGGHEEEVAREEAHLKQLLNFSDKAIFEKDGRARLTEWSEGFASGKTPDDFEELIQEFVWEMMERKFQTHKGEQKELRSHVEYAVRIAYLKGRIEHLQSRIDEMREPSKKEKERYEHEKGRLEEKLKSAEEDLEAIRGTRMSLAA